MPNPWEEDWSQPQQAQPVRVGSVDPFKVKDDARADAAAARAAAAADRANRNSEASNSRAEEANRLARERFLYQQMQDAKNDPASIKRGNLTALARQLADVESQLQANFLGENDRGLIEYLPTPTNRKFDTAAGGLSEMALGAFRTPGVGSQSDAELRAFVEANRPGSGEYDEVNLQRIQNIRNRLDEQRAAMGLTPTPQDDQQPIAGAFGAQTPTTGGNPPMGGGGPQTSQVTAINGVGAGQQVATGAMKTIDNPAFKGVNARVNGMLQQGASTQQIVSYLRSAGVNVDDPKIQESLAGAVGWRNRNPNFKGNYSVNVDDMAVPTTALERFGATPVGSAAAGYLNAGGLGVPEMLAPETFAGMRAQNPLSSLGGEVGGAITGTSLIGRAAGAGAAKVAPRLLGGGKGAQFARNLGTDAAYGAAYGGTTQGDPLSGALYGTLGSAGGQAVGSAVGRAASGATMSRPVQALRAKGIPLTVGQAFSQNGRIGGMVKGIEDRLSGLPVIGESVNARRMEGLEGFNRAAMDEALAPISMKANGLREEGIAAAQDGVGNAYDSALSGVRVDPNDPQFVGDMQGVLNRGRQIPMLGSEFDYTIASKVAPNFETGVLDGKGLQASLQALRGDARAFKSQPRGAEFGDAARGAETSIMDLVNRQAPDVMPQLNAANKAYGNLSILEDAVLAAKNTDGIFTPAQLGQASVANTKKYGGKRAAAAGNRPFATLQRIGQNVLPSKVPDSGTAGRLATLALPAALGGTGAGLGYTGGEIGTGVAGGLTLGAALTLMGTKKGQAALIKTLADRPSSVRGVGRAIRKKKGLFGHAAAPLAIENSGQ